MGEAFYWLSFGLFRKNGNHLLWQCLSLCMKRLCHICDCFISTARWKYSLFLLLSHRRNPRLRHLAGCSFGTSRKKHQPFSITRAIRFFDDFQKIHFEFYRVEIHLSLQKWISPWHSLRKKRVFWAVAHGQGWRKGFDKDESLWRKGDGVWGRGEAPI